jgi:hypothetical protein
MGQKPGSRAEEDALGASRAYLVEYAAEDLINWSLDEQGNYEWVVLRTELTKQDRVEDGEWRREKRWAYYDKQSFRLYRQVITGGGGEPVELIDEGPHGLAKLQRVPLFGLRIPEGLWMLNRAGSLQLEHFNKSNALSWALTMGLFATPVIYSERPFHQMMGESYYIQLGANDRFGWTEPEGKVYQIAADNLVRLKDEIYRVCYLMNQAGSPSGGDLPVSGISKQRDFSVTQEVLRAYGDAVKDAMRQVLWAIGSARQDALGIEVTGLDEFDINDFSDELDDAKKLLELGIGSETLKKQVFKTLALKYLGDARQEVKNRVAEEIESQGN